MAAGVMLMKGVKGFYYPQTLCWDCQKACGGCSWSDEYIPVDGWIAIYHPIKADHMGADVVLDSYFVRRCPQFVRDSAERLASVID